MQKRLDTLMGMPEYLQFAIFTETYLKKYNPDGEGIAKFVREFVYQNLGSVFVVSDSFTSGFDFLEEIFYNKELQGYFVSYWNENPRTKTGAEFLLTLASLYDFERRAAAYLLDSYEIAKRILSGEEKLPRAFSQKAKAYVLKEVCEDLISRMVDRGIKSEDELLSLYRREQERIYQLVIDMGGEERDRALYVLGRLFWDEGKYEEAILRWSEISDFFAFKTYQDIKHALTIYDSISIPISADLPDLVPRINAIFEWESSENDNLLLKRLMDFHKWKKRRAG
jgi:tetratricopeptide (TPR) repeat protein